MHTEYFVIDDCSDGQVIKQVCEQLPHSWTPKLALALRVKPIHLGDLPSFVIPSQ